MDTFDEAIRAHDEAVRACGLELWLGGEPTFSDRTTFAAEWSWAADGADKEARARAVIARLHEGTAGVVLRTLGRQYAGEELPRWSYGSWSRRDGARVWSGPADPLETRSVPLLASADAPDRSAPSSTAEPTDDDGAISASTTTLGSAACTLRDALSGALSGSGALVACFDIDGALPLRLVFRTDGVAPITDTTQEPRLARVPLGTEAVAETGAIDELAAGGAFLVCVGMDTEHRGCVRVELPAIASVAAFRALLDAVAEAAHTSGQSQLVLCGFPPPVDEAIAWTTVTPDPGVLEINMAPTHDVTAYLAALRRTHSACAAEGLAPLRYLYTGEIVDSGGGGHVTFGGPSATASPFLRRPHLLPALIAYANRHPCLSYLFAVESLGSSSQSPRADECVRESFDELSFAIESLALRDEPDPERLWRSLAPFLVDRSGNSHRAEINVEKLWNPYLPGRGRLGLVEMRAFRMARTPERGAAVAALLRAVLAMLAKEQRVTPLVDWGDELHDRFMLPFHLEADLLRVLADLALSGMHLHTSIVSHLLADDDRIVGTAEACEHTLTVRRAIEPWPLVGDASAQERNTSRTVDPSGRRLELCVRPRDGAVTRLDECRVAIDGMALPMVRTRDERSEALVLGLRYRAFVPAIGLHPSLPARGPITLLWSWPARARAWAIELHAWRPEGGAYDGLPVDDDEARTRREERFVVREISYEEDTAQKDLPARAVRGHHVDLRWLDVLASAR